MSEPERVVDPQAPHDGSDPLKTRIASLRSQGAWRFDPVRFAYLEALSRHLPGQTEAVRRLLHDKLQAALADYSEQAAQARQAAAGAAALLPGAHPGLAALVQLNHYIRDAVSAGRQGSTPNEAGESGELASVRRFRHAWSRSRAQEQLVQANARKPVKAGPLNSHLLLLDSLGLMRELSPDYLRRFLVHVESLQWLDQAREKYPRTDKQIKTAKPARRIRQKK